MKFGTDGVRGRANSELTASFALDLGRAAARVLGASTAVVGGDSRISTPMLEAAFVAGLSSEGVEVHPSRRGADGCDRVRGRPPGRNGCCGVGLPQPVRGQRHQAVRGGRYEAARRARTADRAGARRRCPRRRASRAACMVVATSAATSTISSACSRGAICAGCASWSTPPTVPLHTSPATCSFVPAHRSS